MKRLFLFLGWQSWKRVVRRPIVIELFNGLRFRAYPDCDVSPGVLYMRIPDYATFSSCGRTLGRVH